MVESGDERPNYIIVLSKGKYYMIKLTEQQLQKFWHLWNTDIKEKPKSS